MNKDINRDPVFHNSVDYEATMYDICNLPSAQPDLCDGCDRYGASCVGEGCGKLEMPEIIRCRDCISYQEGIDIDGKPFTRCNGSVRTYGHTLPDWYCADAERRTDGKSINASDLIDWIMCAFPDWCVGDVRAIVDHVNEMPSAQPEPRWIPCSERLPEEDGLYLVTSREKATAEEFGFDLDNVEVKKMRFNEDGWRIPKHIPEWINGVVHTTVLAWMPLPEPYKAESEVEE